MKISSEKNHRILDELRQKAEAKAKADASASKRKQQQIWGDKEHPIKLAVDGVMQNF